MSKRLVIVGASGHGKVIADIGEKNGYTEILFLDDNKAVKTCGKYSVVGTSGDAMRYSSSDFIVGIGNAKIRKRLQEELIAKGLHIGTLVHPKSVVALDVSLGAGTVVMAGAIINPGSIVGNGCIINTGATVDHDNVIEDYVHVSVGSHLAGTVSIGTHTWIGAGAIVSNNVSICENCVIGAGAVVVKNITESDTYIGVPARRKTMNCEMLDGIQKMVSGGVLLLADKYIRNMLCPSVAHDLAGRAA